MVVLSLMSFSSGAVLRLLGLINTDSVKAMVVDYSLQLSPGRTSGSSWLGLVYQPLVPVFNLSQVSDSPRYSSSKCNRLYVRVQYHMAVSYAVTRITVPTFH